MKMNKTLPTGLAILLILSLTGCGGGAAKKNAEAIEAGSEHASALVLADNGEFLAKLLRNNAKLVRLDPVKEIREYNGQPYTSTDIGISGSKYIPCDAFAIVGDAIVYTEYPGYFELPFELWRMDMQGGAKTLIAKNAKRFGVIFAGDRVIYEASNYPKEEDETSGLFCYDLKTSKNTKLLDRAYSVVSFDDDYVYFDDGYVGRVRWNGGQVEFLEGVIMPEGLYKVEGDYYYCYNDNTDQISRYKVTDGMLTGIEPIYGILWEIVDGWAYYVNEQMGLYKVNLTNGATVPLAEFKPFEKSENTLGIVVGGMTGTSIYLYFIVEEEDDYVIRWYKVPIDGGTMELIFEGGYRFETD